MWGYKRDISCNILNRILLRFIVMGCGAAEATGLGVVLSTLVFYQPTELIWAFSVS